VIRIVPFSIAALVVLASTMILTALVSIQPFAEVAGKYLCIAFDDLYTNFEYQPFLNTLSLWLRGPVPAIVGVTSQEVFNAVVEMMKGKYVEADLTFFWAFVGDLSSRFYSMTIPLTLILMSLFYSSILELISVRRVLQIIAVMGFRKYYATIVLVAVAIGLLYTLTASLPVLLYACSRCDMLWKLAGASTLILLFSAILLLEALTYVLAEWNSAAALVVGIAISISMIVDPRIIMLFADASRRIFGFNISVLRSLTTLLITIVVELLLLYLAISRKEVY